MGSNANTKPIDIARLSARGTSRRAIKGTPIRKHSVRVIDVAVAAAVEPQSLSEYGASVREHIAGIALPAESLVGPIIAYHLELSDCFHGAATLWAGRACGLGIEPALAIAASIELYHSFQVMHEEIQAGTALRGSRETAWGVWGSAQTLNAGDALHAIASRTLIGAAPQPHLLIRAIRTVAEAVLETMERHTLTLTDPSAPADSALDERTRANHCSTGALLGAGLEVAAVVAGGTDPLARKLRRAGRLLGAVSELRAARTQATAERCAEMAVMWVERCNLEPPASAAFAEMAQYAVSRNR